MEKRKTIFNILNWLKDAGLKALVILLVVTAGFYAYAQINWPADPNPTTGVVGVFVGASTEAYGANAFRGYDEVNGMCETAYEDSHICTPAEMTNSYNHGTLGVSAIFLYNEIPPILWVNSAAPGNVFPAVNDCKGWSDNGLTPYYGTVWNFNLIAAAIQPCAAELKFACCK